MAEFVEIMNIKRRMDNYYDDCSCGCPLYESNFCFLSEDSLTTDDFKEAEKIMLDWAEEHPIIYPTWGEFLYNLYPMMGPSTITDILEFHVPPALAEKLELEQKEV